MKYTPKTEAELVQELLLPDGDYDFEVIETSDRPSKKGNEMVMLKLCVFDHDGNERIIFDYMVFGNPIGERKFRHAAQACGLIETYTAGRLTADDFMNKSGKISVRQQKGSPEYPMPKNVVGDYLAPNGDETPKPRKAKEILNDEIPF